MSLDGQIANRRIKRLGPLGKIASLLTAGLVSLIGLAMGIEPDVILWRAVIASVSVGCFVAFGVSVVQAANDSRG